MRVSAVSKERIYIPQECEFDFHYQYENLVDK